MWVLRGQLAPLREAEARHVVRDHPRGQALRQQPLHSAPGEGVCAEAVVAGHRQLCFACCLQDTG